jgi:hypothetical protein
MNCPNCSTVNEPDYRFCRECGRRLAPAAPEAAVAPAAVAAPPRDLGRRRALLAVGAGALTLGASAVGLYLSRGPRSKPAARVARTAPVPTVGLPPASAVGGLRPGPAPAAQPAPGSPEGPGALALKPPRPFVGPLIPADLAAQRRREAANSGLSPAAVRRVEPGAPSITIEPSPPAGTTPSPVEAREGSNPSQKPERPAAGAGTPAAAASGGSLINIQVLGEGGTPAPEAPPAERARPAQLDISIQPSTFAPLQEARGQMQEGRRLQAEGRIRQARDAYAAAERLFRFAAQRGGSEAAAARQGLAEAQRALQSARALKDRNGEE